MKQRYTETEIRDHWEYLRSAARTQSVVFNALILGASIAMICMGDEFSQRSAAMALASMISSVWMSLDALNGVLRAATISVPAFRNALIRLSALVAFVSVAVSLARFAGTP